MDKKPKDYQLAESGYNAFYGEQPQVFFDDLSHDYQMRWVRAGRAMITVHDSFKTGPRPRASSTTYAKHDEDVALVDEVQQDSARTGEPMVRHPKYKEYRNAVDRINYYKRKGQTENASSVD